MLHALRLCITPLISLRAHIMFIRLCTIQQALTASKKYRLIIVALYCYEGSLIAAKVHEKSFLKKMQSTLSLSDCGFPMFHVQEIFLPVVTEIRQECLESEERNWIHESSVKCVARRDRAQKMGNQRRMHECWPHAWWAHVFFGGNWKEIRCDLCLDIFEWPNSPNENCFGFEKFQTPLKLISRIMEKCWKLGKLLIENIGHSSQGVVSINVLR